jgi:hypothetical protein
MYSYQTERAAIFSENGQRDFLRVRDAVMALLLKAGAARMQEILREAAICGDSWRQLAFVDRLVELGEIRELTNSDAPGQYRVFVGARQ